jgi:hypothetical protein
VFLALDPGSEIVRRLTQAALIRQGRYDDALAIALPGDDPFVAWLRGCLTRRPPTAASPLPAVFDQVIDQIRDSEPKYTLAGFLAFCGEREAALKTLRKGVEQNFCAYPAIDKDPLFDSIRRTPEFAAIRKMGIACQERFLAHRAAAKK